MMDEHHENLRNIMKTMGMCRGGRHRIINLSVRVCASVCAAYIYVLVVKQANLRTQQAREHITLNLTQGLRSSYVDRYAADTTRDLQKTVRCSIVLFACC